MIVRKLEYFEESASDRHLRDIAGLLRISGDHIDRESLMQLIEDRRLAEVWERASTIELS